MNAKEFKDEIYAHYFDDDLQVTIDRDPSHWSTGNGQLHLGTFLTILGLNSAIDPADQSLFNKSVDQCWTIGKDNKKTFGLLNRNHGRVDVNSPDNYIGICAGSVFAKSSAAGDIAFYGNANNWSYDNQHPNQFTLSDWHGRFPGLIGFYKICGGESPGTINTWLLLAKFSAGVSSDHSVNIQTWVQAQAIKRMSSRFNDQITKWGKSFQNRYKSVGDMLSQYYGPTHPMAQVPGYTGVFS